MKNLKRQAIEQRSRARRQLLQALYQWQMSGDDPWSVRRNRLVDPKTGDIDDDYFNAAFDTISEKRDLYDTRVAEHTHRRPSTLDPSSAPSSGSVFTKSTSARTSTRP